MLQNYEANVIRSVLHPIILNYDMCPPVIVACE